MINIEIMVLVEGIHEFNDNMTWMKALIITSCFSYLGATVVSLMGLPIMEHIDVFTQSINYLVMFTLLLLALRYNVLRIPLAAVYGVLAMLSFSGIQVWINYAGDKNILGPAMAAWDLALAIALLIDGNQ
ncbi:MAG: hypothetical protein ACXACY_30170 [Candidatus Hodarchaeales archaeon]|jgi:hypothetical protein